MYMTWKTEKRPAKSGGQHTTWIIIMQPGA